MHGQSPFIGSETHVDSPGAAHMHDLADATLRLDTSRLEEWGRLLAVRLTRGARLLVAGNGGSAAEAQHLTSELVGRFHDDRAPLSALALHADSSSITAIGNDYGFDELFARQVRAHGRAGDVLLLLSTSGSSANLLRAAEVGHDLELLTWALTGPEPNTLARACDEAVCVSATSVATVQECHLAALHVVCAAVDTQMLADCSLDAHHRPGAGPRREATVDPGSTGDGAPRDLVIVGDILLDVDIIGSAERLSPEAPVPVVSRPRTTRRPGGAGRAALIAAGETGWRVTLVGALGKDTNGHQVRALLADAGIDLIDLGVAGSTPSRTRVRARGQTVVRIDDDGEPLRLGELPWEAQEVLRKAAAVVVCDYGQGVTGHDGLRGALAELTRHVPVVWDPHPRGHDPVPEVALAVPTSSELRTLAGHTDDTHEGLEPDVRNARRLLHTWQARQVAVTRGSSGAVLVSDSVSPPLVVSCHPVDGDTCGAGDRFAVAAAVLLAQGRLPSQAVSGAVEAATAYVAGGNTNGLRTPPAGDRRCPDDVMALVEHVRARGGRIIGTGGCFDLLHAGHLSLLEQARRLGDCLIVCMNSDTSVSRVKGPERPVVDQAQRAAMLSALTCVDGVLIFDEDTPHVVLETLRPDVWVKGGDYAGRRLPESDLIESWGGQIVVVAYLEGNSTTSLIERVTKKRGAT